MQSTTCSRLGTHDLVQGSSENRRRRYQDQFQGQRVEPKLVASEPNSAAPFLEQLLVSVSENGPHNTLPWSPLLVVSPEI